MGNSSIDGDHPVVPWSDGLGVVGPLHTLSELLSWAPLSREDYVSKEIYIAHQKLPKNRVEGLKSEKPKILCCHDMKGGYLEDKYVFGGKDGEGYSFRHWHSIDGFVYFSHHFVTIPPPMWIEAAHKHGCPVLGTFITEWEEGTNICEEMLGTEAKMERAAHQLAQIAAQYRFEGWIVNIENEIRKPLMEKMVEFLKLLTTAMHRAVPGSQVIWYDAVTIEGKLEWQNTLNELNIPFFAVCDGIWINYTWKEGDPGKIRDLSGNRVKDVYLGVDCFGRGTYGGGGMNTYMALDLIRNAGLNAALFACGWPYERYHECREGDDDDQEKAAILAAYSSWYSMDEEFWYRIDQTWSHRRETVVELPFYTDFSCGSGNAYFSAGVVCSREPWYNLSLQGVQTPVWLFNMETNAGIQTDISQTISYNSTNSLVMRGGVGEATRIRMMQTKVPLRSKDGICVRVSAAIAKGVFLRICLKVIHNNPDLRRESAVIEFDCSQQNADALSISKTRETAFASTVLLKSATRALKSNKVLIDGSDITQFPLLQSCSWTTFEFTALAATELPSWVFQEGVLINVDAVLVPSTPGSVCKCNIAVGDICINFPDSPFPPSIPVGQIHPENIDLRLLRDSCGAIIGRSLSMSLLWNRDRFVHRYQVWMKTAIKNEREGIVWGKSFLLGVTQLSLFLVRDLDIDFSITAARFYILSEIAGRVQSLRTAESITLQLPSDPIEPKSMTS